MGYCNIYFSYSAIVAIEPGFGPTVGSNGYNALVSNKILIVFYYGDYIGGSYNGNIPASSMWDGMRETAYTFKTSYESAGLTCTIYNLPDEGIYGNDHVKDWIKDNANSIFIKYSVFALYLLQLLF